LAEKPILMTEHATMRYVSLNLTPDLIREAIRRGKRVRLGKQKSSATIRTKRGTIVVIFIEYSDHIHVVTVTRGRKGE
jgi:hypothetical protein